MLRVSLGVKCGLEMVGRFTMLPASSWSAWWSKFWEVEAMRWVFSVSCGDRLWTQWKSPENWAEVRWKGFESKNELILWVSASFVPFSDRLSAPVISCKSALFFEVREPMKGSSGWWARHCWSLTTSFSFRILSASFFFCVFAIRSASFSAANLLPSADVNTLASTLSFHHSQRYNPITVPANRPATHARLRDLLTRNSNLEVLLPLPILLVLLPQNSLQAAHWVQVAKMQRAQRGLHPSQGNPPGFEPEGKQSIHPWLQYATFHSQFLISLYSSFCQQPSAISSTSRLSRNNSRSDLRVLIMKFTGSATSMRLLCWTVLVQQPLPPQCSPTECSTWHSMDPSDRNIIFPQNTRG